MPRPQGVYRPVQTSHSAPACITLRGRPGLKTTKTESRQHNVLAGCTTCSQVMQTNPQLPSEPSLPHASPSPPPTCSTCGRPVSRMSRHSKAALRSSRPSSMRCLKGPRSTVRTCTCTWGIWACMRGQEVRGLLCTDIETCKGPHERSNQTSIPSSQL